MRELKVDLHFHPNFYGMGWSKGVAIDIFEVCIRNKLDVLAITEHVYKDPIRTFWLMYDTQQELIRGGDPKYQQLKNLILFPGMEYLTMEGADMVMFHHYAENGKSIIHEVMEHRNHLLLKPFALSVTEAIDVAQQYGIAIYAPHPYILGSTGGIKALGKAVNTTQFRTRVAQIVNNRRIGLGIHNGAFDSVRDILKVLNITVPLFEMITSTPQELIDEADPRFYSEGADAHTPGSMGTCLLIPFEGEFTRENVFEALVSNKQNKIFRPKKGFFAHTSHLRAGLKQLGITIDEVITEAKIEKQMEKEKRFLLEAYTKAFERDMPLDVITKIKNLFPGRGFMLMLSKDQVQRIKTAIEKKKGKFGAKELEAELEKREML